MKNKHNHLRRQRKLNFTSSKMFKTLNKFLKCHLYLSTNTRGLCSERHVWENKSLEEILESWNKRKDSEIYKKVDISLPPPKQLLSVKKTREMRRLFLKNKSDLLLEKKARNLEIGFDTDVVRTDWVKSDAPKHIQMAAEHYNVFEDLFGYAYFTPYVVMDIYYPQEGKDMVAPVCRGNVVKPAEAFLQPVVKFDSQPEELWTLTLVNPDGHLTEDNMEYIHWFIGNIPGGDVSRGEVIWDYLPPFPPRGIGFQRFIFVLYKQEKRLDYSSLKKELPCLELKDRSFKTLNFYKERQDDLTPGGLSFFQSDWDKSARKVFHEILNMEEPVFEYDFEPQYYKKQEWFPLRRPFNTYLDNYRDPRDVNQEYVERQLKESHPFKAPEKPFPYPKAIKAYYKGMPSWLVRKEEYYRLQRGRVSNIEREEYE